MTITYVLDKLKEVSNYENVVYKRKKFGIIAHNALGVFMKDINAMAREIGTNNDLAVALFDTGIYEGRLLCSKVFKPKNLTKALMEQWVVTFENWEVCDSFSMALFAKSKHAVSKINEWSSRSMEFEKRAAFATLAAYCMADKKADNQIYRNFFPLILREATDDRLYVKKAVNWALRSIGKRNKDLNKEAIQVANELIQTGSASAKWIGSDALKELEGKKVRISDYPRSIYRPLIK